MNDANKNNGLTTYSVIIWDRFQDYKKNNQYRFESICNIANTTSTLNGMVDLDTSFSALHPPSKITIHISSKYEKAVRSLHCVQELVRWD
jgi:hypothetical protein